MQPGAESEHLRGFFFSRSQKIEVSPTLGAKFSAVDNESFEKPEICFLLKARAGSANRSRFRRTSNYLNFREVCLILQEALVAV